MYRAFVLSFQLPVALLAEVNQPPVQKEYKAAMEKTGLTQSAFWSGGLIVALGQGPQVGLCQPAFPPPAWF